MQGYLSNHIFHTVKVVVFVPKTLSRFGDKGQLPVVTIRTAQILAIYRNLISRDDFTSLESLPELKETWVVVNYNNKKGQRSVSTPKEEEITKRDELSLLHDDSLIPDDDMMVFFSVQFLILETILKQF